MKYGYIYILSNSTCSVLYIGVTNNLSRRILEHKKGVGSSFTARYKLHRLVYFERLTSMDSAIVREKQLKNWKRIWKVELIKGMNPGFEDLSADWFNESEL
jgi:putative endonuclease